MRQTTTSEVATRKLAAEFAATLRGGDVVCLYGELGAGKTTFVKGLAEALGVAHTITSPTFTLMNIYAPARSPGGIAQLIHIDTYRLENEAELRAIGAEDYIGKPTTLTLIEWPEKIDALLQNKPVKKIFFSHRDDGGRDIRVA